jgi:alpha(1,3/1,4) fucosyltransferase
MKTKVSLNFIDFPPQSKAFFLDLLSPHYDFTFDDTPDFLFYSHIGHRHRLYNCTKIFHTQEKYWPNWRECDYAAVSVLVDDPRSAYLPIYAFDGRPEKLVRTSVPDPVTVRASKPHFCSLLCAYVDRTVRRREQFFYALNRLRKVDSAGRALNNTGYRLPPGDRYQVKVDWLAGYRFNLAFENTRRAGWCTEKLVDPLHVNTIPIYWGDPRVKDYFNPESFICRDDFLSDEELADYVLHVDDTPELYARYIRATPFHDNRPNSAYDRNGLLSFFDQIFRSRQKPITQKRWFFKITKWRLAKRNKLPGE